MRNKCKYCGYNGNLKELILMPDNNYICISCWNLQKNRNVNRNIHIKFLDDGIPAIILPPNIISPIESIDVEDFKDEFYLEDYYCEIMDETGLTREQIEIMVKAKIEEFTGLVSEETALLMIAKDLGIFLQKKKRN